MNGTLPESDPVGFRFFHAVDEISSHAVPVVSSRGFASKSTPVADELRYSRFLGITPATALLSNKERLFFSRHEMLEAVWNEKF